MERPGQWIFPRFSTKVVAFVTCPASMFHNAINDHNILFLALFYFYSIPHLGLMRAPMSSSWWWGASPPAPAGWWGGGALLSSGDECVSKSEGYQIETDLCRPPMANCHPAILLPLVTWWVTATDVDGFWPWREFWFLKTRERTRENEAMKLAAQREEKGMGTRGVSDSSSWGGKLEKKASATTIRGEAGRDSWKKYRPTRIPGQDCDTCLHTAINNPAWLMLMIYVNFAISFICARCWT